VDSSGGESFEVLNPADGSVLTRVAKGNARDVDHAVKAARKAFDDGPWRTMPARARGRLLYKLADLIERDADAFAQLESLDNGKPWAWRAPRTWRSPSSTSATTPAGPTRSRARSSRWPCLRANNRYLNYTVREPVGVVGQIIPWNFPLLMAAWKLGAALTCGCTVILKPAEQTPLSALYLGRLFAEAGFPEGVVNIITGFGDAGAASPTTRTWTRWPSPAAPRWARDHQGLGAGHQARHGGAGRQVAQHRVQGQRSRDRSQGRLQRDLLQPGQCCCAGSRCTWSARPTPR
jgi:phenylacetaldehyde dehydrogenase